MELYPIVVASILWGQSWSKKRVLFLCDNQSTVHILNKGCSKCPQLMSLMHTLTWNAASYNYIVRAQYVPGRLNNIADSLSRFQMDRLHSLVPGADPTPTQCPPSSDVMWCGIEHLSPAAVERIDQSTDKIYICYRVPVPSEFPANLQDRQCRLPLSNTSRSYQSSPAILHRLLLRYPETETQDYQDLPGRYSLHIPTGRHAHHLRPRPPGITQWTPNPVARIQASPVSYY